MINNDPNLIPEGLYCYGLKELENGEVERTICPYWHKDYHREEQNNGYCSYLDEGDWEHEGIGLLWDQCKECGRNLGDEDGEW